MKLTKRTLGYAIFTVAVVALLAWWAWPSPRLVETARAGRGPVQVAIEEDGETRAVDRYGVAAPVAGRLLRVVLREGDAVKAGQVVAEVDPDGQIAEVDETDNAFPASGRRAVEVRTVPPLVVRLVPVRQSANGLVGDVDDQNADDYLDIAQRMFPLPGYDVTEPSDMAFFLHGDIEGKPTLEHRSTVWPRLRRRYGGASTGMASFADLFTRDDVRAIQAYLVREQRRLREQERSKPPAAGDSRR
mgnify:CR=1 FL=1